MKAKGWGGGLICDADGASQDGNDRVQHGPTFLTPEWRDLYKHALREADRLGLEMSLNIQSGWNLGGPMVTAEDAAKKLVWSEMRVTGPAPYDQKLLAPKSRDGYYRDLFLVAYPLTAEDSALASGTASWARCLKSDGSSKVMDCTVGASGANINLNTTAVVAGNCLAVNQFSFTAPKT